MGSKPIVAVEDEGKFTVIAGNHQLQPLKELGWQEIAVAVVSLSEQEALALPWRTTKYLNLVAMMVSFCLILFQVSVLISYKTICLTLSVGMTLLLLMEKKLYQKPQLMMTLVWTAPQIVVSSVPPTINSGEDNVAPSTIAPTTINPVVPTETIVTQGSTSTKVDGGDSAAIQFTLVFSSAEEQSTWYSFYDG